MGRYTLCQKAGRIEGACMSEPIVGGLISERNLVGVWVGLLQQGDLATATQLYEESGRAVAEHLFAQLTRSEQAVLRGRRQPVRAGARLRPGNAAARVGALLARRARLYEEAGGLPSAARCSTKAGERDPAAPARS